MIFSQALSHLIVITLAFIAEDKELLAGLLRFSGHCHIHFFIVALLLLAMPAARFQAITSLLYLLISIIDYAIIIDYELIASHW